MSSNLLRLPSRRAGGAAALLAALALAPGTSAQGLTGTTTIGGMPTVQPKKPGGPGVGDDNDNLGGLGDEPPFDPYAIPGVAGKTFGRTVAGQFNNDGVLDVVLLADDELVLLSGRQLYLSHELAAGVSALDVDVYPGAAPSGQDAIVYTDAAGLHLLWWDFATKALQDHLVEQNAWAGARAVQVREVDGAGRADLLGLSADGHELLILTATADSPPTFVPGTGFSTGFEMLSFVALEWDGTAAPEVAVLTDGPLQVRELDGTLLGQWGTPVPGGWLAAIEEAWSPSDRLAWVTNELVVVDPDTQEMSVAQFVLVFDQLTADPPINTSGVGVTSVLGEDWDGDGDDDLVLGYQWSHDIVVFDNARSDADPDAVSFQVGGDAQLVPIGPEFQSNPSQVSSPAAGDFDEDGDIDVGATVQSSGEFRIARNDTIDHRRLTAKVVDMRYVVTDGSPTGDLELTIGRPKGGPYGITGVRITIWRQADVTGPSDPTPVDSVTFPVNGAWPVVVPLEIPEEGQYFEAVYYLEIRYVRSDGQGTVYFPATLGGFTLSPLVFQQLATVAEADKPVIVVPEGDLVFDPGAIGLLAGAMVTNLRVPPADDGFNEPLD